MTIYRDGKAIELTPQELRQAYYESEREYTIEDIKSRLNDDDNFSEEDIDFAANMFDAFLRRNDDYNDAYCHVLDMAIKHAREHR